MYAIQEHGVAIYPQMCYTVTVAGRFARQRRLAKAVDLCANHKIEKFSLTNRAGYGKLLE